MRCTSGIRVPARGAAPAVNGKRELYELGLFIFCNRFGSWWDALAEIIRRLDKAWAGAADDPVVRPELLCLQPRAEAYGSGDGVRRIFGAGNGVDGVGGNPVVQRAGDCAEACLAGSYYLRSRRVERELWAGPELKTNLTAETQRRGGFF